MTFLRQAAETVWRWLDCVATTIVLVFGWFVRPRVVQFIEGDGQTFTIRAAKDSSSTVDPVPIIDGKISDDLPTNVLNAIRGNRVELILKPSRFLFRPLELPRRAAEFLDGIVRAQIDRITPWAVSEAAFGWGRPTEISAERISVMVAATARSLIAPYLIMASELGAASVGVFTIANEGNGNSTKFRIFDEKFRGIVEVGRVRRVLIGILLTVGVLAGFSIGADVVIGGNLQSEQLRLAHRIDDERTALRSGRYTAAQAALLALDRRKQETPASVIVLEALSKILPDHTYVTELRIEANRVQIVGITHDAPELIRLIERSSHFSRATFVAPTTRSPTDPGERFHIEARIEPVNDPRP
jgi:general secretion pathway protein L